MTLKTPEMSNCNPKQRCLTGVNKGLAYDPSDPCPPDTEFDPVACECITEYPGIDGYWRWTGTILTKNNTNGTNYANLSDCSGSGEIQCTTSWIFVAADYALTWKSDFSGSHTPDTGDLIPVRSAGRMTKTGLCGGSWNVANLYTIRLEDDGLGVYVNPWTMNSAAADCNSSIGTFTDFFGRFEFSPDQDENNITHTYTTTWPFE